MRIPNPDPNKWYDLRGLEGRYQIKSNGEIRRFLPSGKTKSVNAVIDGVSEKQKITYRNKDGESIREYIHRLVYLTFVGDIPDGFRVYHSNKDERDHRVWNLKLSTLQKETIKRNKGKCHPKGVPVVKMDLDGNIVEDFSSITEASISNHYSDVHLGRIMNRSCRNVKIASDGFVYVMDKGERVASMQKKLRGEQYG